MSEPDLDLNIPDLGRLATDVAEACADALLIAAGQALVANGVMPTWDGTREAAIMAIDEVLTRTRIEGARAR